VKENKNELKESAWGDESSALINLYAAGEALG
jgi:hypothetical protein